MTGWCAASSLGMTGVPQGMLSLVDAELGEVPLDVVERVYFRLIYRIVKSVLVEDVYADGNERAIPHPR